MCLKLEWPMTTTSGGIHQAAVTTKRWNNEEEYSLFLGSVTKAEERSLSLAWQSQHITSTVTSWLVRNPSFSDEQSCRCGFHPVTWAFPLYACSTSHNLDLHGLLCPQWQVSSVLGTSSWSQQDALQICPTQPIPGSSISTSFAAIPGPSLVKQHYSYFATVCTANLYAERRTMGREVFSPLLGRFKYI